ncbi:MAG: hypothetical protein ACRERD_31455 [Candidatus Binatia bacterium]
MGYSRWGKGAALLLAVLAASCGGTGGGGSSGSGNQFVFQARGRLNLEASVAANNPTVLTLLATLFDPQGIPLRNQLITFAAEFADATFIPQDRNPATCDPTSCSNRGAALTDDRGQARVTLIAGLMTGRMRVIAEAPLALNIFTGLSVTLTNQGFVTLGPLGLIPSAITFINPLVGPGDAGPMTLFSAVGGTPPYRYDNSNKDLGRIEPIGVPNINEQATYTLIGPIPTDQSSALQDTVTLMDAAGSQATAMVTVIFAECTLRATGSMFTLTGVGGAQFQVDVTDGVPPFSVTETFPGSVEVSVVVVDANGSIIPGQVCDTTSERCLVLFTLPEAPIAVAPDTILIRDARGCTVSIELTVTLCGNGVIDGNEECDGSDFSGLTCVDFRGPGATGVLRCSDECKFDDSGCREPPMMMP